MNLRVPEFNLSAFISLATFVILLGYIVYQETGSVPASASIRDQSISDEGVYSVAYDEDSWAATPAVSFDVPANLTFAGERVPISIPDVKERLDKELQINCYFHSNTI